MDPKDLLAEAEASERMARLVSYGRDREWLTAKAQELRRQAERLQKRAWERDTPRRLPAPGPLPPRRRDRI